MTSDFLQRLLELPRFVKRLIMLITDAALCFLTVQFAFFLRLGEWQPVDERPLYATIAAIVIALPLFVTTGLYRAIFRYSGISAMQSIVKSCVLFAIPYLAIFTFVGVPGVPRTVGIIEPILLFLTVAGTRAFIGWWLGASYRNAVADESSPRSVIFGAGETGRLLQQALAASPQIRIVGFADNDPRVTGSTLANLPVHSLKTVERLAADNSLDEVILATPNLPRKDRLELVERLTRYGLHVRMPPDITDIVLGNVTMADLKDVAIEDLLSRSPVPPDKVLLSQTILGRTVLVTGAGGSIGSELCRQILAQSPKQLVLVEASEYNLYAIEAELRGRMVSTGQSIPIIPCLASIRDSARMAEIFDQYLPQTIYHAAAYKHVPLLECNPREALLNNIVGSNTLITLAENFDVEYFILISSDKAVRPTNVMGATKRMAELIVQASAAENPGKRFSMVRFGNVLGSSGSVVPKFREQIAAGGPVTVTHPEMTRYFMTIPEASQLVIQAASMSQGGEVFVLDMGSPVKIVDLARNMIQLSGRTVRDDENPDGDIEIAITGVRDGEKLYEELLIGDDPECSSHPLIMKAKETRLSADEIRHALADMQHALDHGDVASAIRVLMRTVPEYSSSLIMNPDEGNNAAPLETIR